MSTVKNVPKRGSVTKEKSVVSTKTSTTKSSNARSLKKDQEAHKKSPDKSPEEKEVTKKSSLSTRDSLKAKSVTSKSVTKHAQNISVPSKTTTDSKTSQKVSLTKTKPNVPSTSSNSSRVKKSQYFPSKNLYSNALKSVDLQSKIPEDGIDVSTKKHSIRTLKEKATPRSSVLKKSTIVTSSPRNINIKSESLKKHIPSSINETITVNHIEEDKRTPRDSSPDTSSIFERPRTATLRKGSIVNENIVGPEAPHYIKSIPAIKEPVLQNDNQRSPTSDDNNYEEDFDSYESDFEADTSSGNPISGESSSVSSSDEEVSEKRNLSPLPLQKDNKRLSSAGTDDERKLDSGAFELTDFKHRQILRHIEDTIKKEDAILEQDNLREKASHPSLSDEGFEDQKSLQFVNFADAKKKCEKTRASAARKKRGEELLGMIKLDAMSFTIFDSPAVSYDVYITNYGQGNSVQASMQTGDDDLSEEIQTDVIVTSTKWTQMPNRFTNFDEGNATNFWIQYKSECIGTGDDEITDHSKNELSEINETRLSNFLRHSGELMIQTLSEKTMSNIENLAKSKNDLPFSSGYLQFDTSGEVFRNTSVRSMSVHSNNVSKVLTVHLKNYLDDDFIRSIICVWDLGELNAPRTVLVSFGEVCCVAFSLENDKHVLAGQNDGAVLIWNIKEKRKLYNIPSQTPSFVTPIGSSHLSKVISVQSLLQNQKTLENNEICTLDDTGTIVLWTLYSDTDSGESISDVVLINTLTIHLQDLNPQLPDLSCSDCIIMDDHVYVSTNYGFILHHWVRSNRTGVRIFTSEAKIDATCLESCPFSPFHFVAGYSNGDISLFSRTTERPLLVLQNKEQIDASGVQIILWSKTKPFLFYAKDLKNRIHIWDLGKSDMYPECSIAFPEKISSMKLSPALNIEKGESAYMLIGTEDGKIYLHLLRKEYGEASFETYHEQVKIFLNYVNRL